MTRVHTGTIKMDGLEGTDNEPTRSFNFEHPLVTVSITALHLAAEADHPDTVTVLLQAGADRHARDDKDRTPLNIAVTRGHTGTIRALLEGTDNEPTISFNFKHPLVTVSIKGVQRSDLYDEETKVMLKRAAELTAWSAKQLQSQVKKR